MLDGGAAAIALDDSGVVDESVDGGEGHGLAREHLSPFAERLVGGDQQRTPLVAQADELEQSRPLPIGLPLGAMSTRLPTPDGKARAVAAMVEGRRRWVERMKAEGKRFPGGRKAGVRWVTPGMRARAADEHTIRRGAGLVATLREERGRRVSEALDAAFNSKAQRRAAIRGDAGAGGKAGSVTCTGCAVGEVPKDREPAPLSPVAV